MDERVARIHDTSQFSEASAFSKKNDLLTGKGTVSKP